MKRAVVPEPEQTDVFDRLPDPIVLSIFNHISDIKTLIRCRAVSRGFNSLVPQTDSLLLRVDRVISSNESDDEDSFLTTLFRSLFKSLNLVSPKPLTSTIRTQNSPTKILRCFDRIRDLEIELPSGDLKMSKGAVIKWKAVFGKTLKSAVILGFGRRRFDGYNGCLKERVVWTISALIAASARHYMVMEVVKDHKSLRKLVVGDRENEGTVVVDEIGLKELRGNAGGDGQDEEGQEMVGSRMWWKNNRSRVPSVKMRMRHEPVLELSNGVKMEGATLVVVRPLLSGSAECEGDEQIGDAGLISGAFEGVYAEAVERLLKTRAYLLEMNSF